VACCCVSHTAASRWWATGFASDAAIEEVKATKRSSPSDRLVCHNQEETQKQTSSMRPCVANMFKTYDLSQDAEQTWKERFANSASHPLVQSTGSTFPRPNA
jgi:hypothetical protein